MKINFYQKTKLIGLNPCIVRLTAFIGCQSTIVSTEEPEFVFSQFEIVVSKLAPNGIFLLDDIYFSEDMKYAWKTIAVYDRVKASAAIERVGIVELKG